MISEKRSPGPWKLAEQIAADGTEERVVFDAFDEVMFRLPVISIVVFEDRKHSNVLTGSETDNMFENDMANQHTVRMQET